MYNNYYPAPDPYQQRLDSMQRQMLPRLDVIRVNGRNGAEAFRMAPNSSALLLDETASVVWLVQSDGAGYHTATPFAISPMQQAQPEDMYKSLDERLSRLEAMIHESHSQQTEPDTAK